jgi:hypothetical protein
MRVVGRQIGDLQFHCAIDWDTNDSLSFIDPAIASQRLLIFSIEIIEVL